MDDITAISAEPREMAGRGAARALRRSGRVPAVIYGDDKDTLLVSVDSRDLHREIGRGGFGNRLYDVAVNGGTHRVLPREIQVDPVTDVPLHVDFLRLGARARVRLMVPVAFADEEESPGLKRGGVLNVVRHEIEFFCRADAIPQVIGLSLSGLDIGDSIHINDVTLPEGVSPTIADRNFTIATIAAPTTQVEEEVEEEEEGVEGEVVEGEEGAEPAAGEVPAETEPKEK